jgi:chemotaxis protein MotB
MDGANPGGGGVSAGEEESTLQELVIIRRRGGDEEASHKGGVWKIAYADFMTAMMAFFLVMWLINATDKKVLTQVATYFNPLRLTDKSPTPRGLHDSDTGAPGSENSPGQSKVKDGTAKGAKLSPAQQKIVEDALFSDPYGTLEVLAQQAARGAREQPRTNAAPDKPAAAAQSPGEAFRDPFDPEARQIPTKEIVDAARTQTADAQSAAVADAAADTPPGSDSSKENLHGQGNVAAAPADASEHRTKEGANPDLVQRASAEIAEKGAREATEAKAAAERAETATLDAEIRQAVSQVGQGASPDIEVKITDDGVLVSLTDKFDFGMFAIASAEPRPAMVAIMERIAKVLQTRPGQLIVRGHTDGRPFRSANYDNWRLSTARAHMAHYMLVRGGLDEKRFERVEGYADRSLRVPNDPEAAQNRRIELLLRKPKP